MPKHLGINLILNIPIPLLIMAIPTREISIQIAITILFYLFAVKSSIHDDEVTDLKTEIEELKKVKV